MANRTWLFLCLLANLAGTPNVRSGDALPLHPPLPMIQTAEPRAMIVFRDGRLSVSAHAAPWEEVLPALEHHIGIQLRVKGPLAGTLTQAFEALPLEQGLRRLFRHVNTVFFYAPDPDTGTAAAPLTQVWLIPREGEAAHPLPSSLGSAATVLQGAPNRLRDSAARSFPQEEVPPAGEEKEEEEEQEEEGVADSVQN